ncbi:uncharacterized protein LOC118800026 [Colossoma macropomum]|uniref:uncharacterized protein LOC118800026 n=1 Tax=Colossoma macropomum TaxID=42526 RepID=UPI00186419D0|nr:uncharacterized protein LOC118800026 [Colossoma macropomum]
MAAFRNLHSSTAWLLVLVLGLSLLQQAAAAFVQTAGSPDLKKLSGQSKIGPTLTTTEDTQETLLPARWPDREVKGLSNDLLLLLHPNIEGSGEGSGLQESMEGNGGKAPSTGVLEINMFILDVEEKRGLEESITDAPPPPAVAQKLTQRIIHDDDHDGLLNDMGTVSTEDATEDKVSTLKAGLEASGSMSNPEVQFIATQTSDMISKLLEPSESLNEENRQEAAELSPVDTKTIQTGFVQTTALRISLSLPLSLSLSLSNISDDDKSKWFGGIFGPITEKGLSDISDPCVLGIGPCVFPTSPNGTLLQWEDLRRTLAFAWELHVFGSAILFLLVVCWAIWGVTGGVGTHHPFCGPLILANTLLLLAGLLRFVQFIVDPYGTKHILPRPVLAALYNLPLALLLWAQITLALLALKGTTLNLLTPALQRPHVTGGLAALHCASLLVADLLSHTLSPALPLMLQTLSICWGLPLCLGILFRALTPLRPATRTPIPRWGAYKRVEERARRVLIVCALLGVLCCALQIHGLLWLYGLLGDWRRFGWGWWLGQFWARLLELSWSLSLLLLGSRAFWRPRGGHRRGDTGQGASGRPEREVLASCLEKILPAGHWKRREHTWADLLPNNWAGYQQSRANLRCSMVRKYEATTDDNVKDSNADNISSGAFNNSNSQSAPRWSHGLEWQERDCVLSLIEFDLCPPSPIELRRSIDNALNFGHLLGSMGSLFTPPPPSWTQSEVSTAPPGCDFATQNTPTHIAYRWALDAGSSPISPQRFRTASQPEVAVLDPQTFLPLDITSERRLWERNSAMPVVNEDGDWMSITSGDDITNL